MSRTLLVVLLLGVLAATIVPAYGWVIPPNPSGEDNRYEIFGPHVKGVLFNIYPNTVTEWTYLNSRNIDTEDWALDKPTTDAWSVAGGPITVVNYGGELGMFELDINNNATYGAALPNPTRVLQLRAAIAYCVNRSWIVNDLCGGLALPMYTMVPTMMGGYVESQISPGGLLFALTYGGDQGNQTAAIQCLNTLIGGTNFPIDTDGYRYWNDSGTKRSLNLIFYSRNGLRGTFGGWLNNIINNVLKIRTNYWSSVPRSVVAGPVFAQEAYQLYTGGWSLGSPTPDFLCDLYNGSNYYNPGSPQNYLGVNDPTLNGYLTQIKLAASIPAGLTATMNAQIRMAQIECVVPLWCASGIKAFNNVPAETAANGNWTHLENTLGSGVDGWFSTLNMYRTSQFYPNYAYWGFSSDVSLLNPVYSQWLWDQNVLGRIYDGGACVDPRTLVTYIPQLFSSWKVGNWTDPVTDEVKTAVTVTIRPDVYWQDGQPFTMADVYYTLVEMSKDILAKNLPPPWWYPTVQYMRSISIIDCYNFQVLLDVNSVWALGWVIGSEIIPMHIWKPIVDATTRANGLVLATNPDPNRIGTGPFRFLFYNPGTNVALVANEPGSVVNAHTPTPGVSGQPPAGTPITSTGYFDYYPIWVDINPDNGLSKVNVNPTLIGGSITSNLTIVIDNLWQGGSIDGDKYVYINGTLQPTFPKHEVLPSVGIWNSTNQYVDPTTSASLVEHISFSASVPSFNYVTVAFNITSPSTIPATGEANPWLNKWVNVTLPIYVTIKEDIAGWSNLTYDLALIGVYGYSLVPESVTASLPTPDLGVDGTDLSVAAAAFGSVPGDWRWSPVGDVSGDYAVDGSDLAIIARFYGW